MVVRGCCGKGRPRRRRIINQSYSAYFKPQGVPLSELEIIELSESEAEALRLSEIEENTQEESAAIMGISQPTFNRELKSGRKKVADAIINKKGIIITNKKNNQGGDSMPNRDGTGPLGKGPATGRGLGPCNTGEPNAERPRLGLGRRRDGRGAWRQWR